MLADVRGFMDDDRFLTLYLRLRDRFGDHGLVGILIAEQDDDAIAIDTWLMSCRVIGRTGENTMFYELCQRAGQRGGRRIRGTFAPARRTDSSGICSRASASSWNTSSMALRVGPTTSRPTKLRRGRHQDIRQQPSANRMTDDAPETRSERIWVT